MFVHAPWARCTLRGNLTSVSRNPKYRCSVNSNRNLNADFLKTRLEERRGGIRDPLSYPLVEFEVGLGNVQHAGRGGDLSQAVGAPKREVRY